MVDDTWKEVVVSQIFMKCIYKALRGREDFDTRHDIDRLRPHSCNGSKYILTADFYFTSVRDKTE